MSHQGRFAGLLLQAVHSLEEAMKAKVEGDVGTLSEKVWEVGADLEYLTFLIGLDRGDVDDSWKENLIPRALDVDRELSVVQSLLREASSAVAADLEKAYRKMWLARGHLLGVQRLLEKATAKQSR